ncbi:MAG: uroporphyrinogen decarboxylase family protein [Synergistales bacterium]|nr:uroporphyrinogen decarboxylase family protein [Synergistales bacterium]
MNRETMTPMERVMTTLQFREPDRVPLFLSLTMHGAKELGLSIEEYYAKAEHVVEGQLRMQAKYRHDCLIPFCYAAAETEAWGGTTIFRDDGPPNSGAPVITTPEMIPDLEPPCVEDSPSLQRILDITGELHRRSRGEIPVLGVVISPFSLPVMQMGFEAYLVLTYEHPQLFQQLMKVNETFCIAWANAQLAAGATAIIYFDPVASPSITTRQTYLQTGYQVARRTLAAIEGPTATHLASGSSLPIVGDLCGLDTQVVCPSADEDLGEVKATGRGRLAVVGNLNGLAMRRWTARQTEEEVRHAIERGGPGGGFVLSDHHGELPFQVPDEVLFGISEAVRRWGFYPLQTNPGTAQER